VQVALARGDRAAIAEDRLHQESADPVALSAEQILERIGIVQRHHADQVAMRLGDALAERHHLGRFA
jgi:hypothetical protein